MHIQPHSPIPLHLAGSSPEGVPPGGLPFPSAPEHVMLVVAPRDGFTAVVERDPDLVHIGEVEVSLARHGLCVFNMTL